jgi:hypothetical protein
LAEVDPATKGAFRILAGGSAVAEVHFAETTGITDSMAHHTRGRHEQVFNGVLTCRESRVTRVERHTHERSVRSNGQP